MLILQKYIIEFQNSDDPILITRRELKDYIDWALEEANSENKELERKNEKVRRKNKELRKKNYDNHNRYL